MVGVSALYQTSNQANQSTWDTREEVIHTQTRPNTLCSDPDTCPAPEDKLLCFIESKTQSIKSQSPNTHCPQRRMERQREKARLFCVYSIMCTKESIECSKVHIVDKQTSNMIEMLNLIKVC